MTWKFLCKQLLLKGLYRLPQNGALPDEKAVVGRFRQNDGGFCYRCVNKMTPVLQIWFEETTSVIANLFRRRHRLKRARHNLAGARALRIVGRPRLQKLGVGENDPELIVQAVEEEAQVGRFVHRSPRKQLLDIRRGAHHAGFRSWDCHAGCGAN